MKSKEFREDYLERMNKAAPEGCLPSQDGRESFNELTHFFIPSHWYTMYIHTGNANIDVAQTIMKYYPSIDDSLITNIIKYFKRKEYLKCK